MGWYKTGRNVSFVIAIIAVIMLAKVSSGELQILGGSKSQNIIELAPPDPTISSLNLTSNVTSVTSSNNALLLISPTTGSVVVTPYNMTGHPFLNNDTNIILYSNETFSGSVKIKTLPGVAGLDLQTLLGASYFTFYDKFLGVYSAQLCLAPCAIGSVALTEGFTFDGAGGLGFLGALSGTSISTTTGTITNVLATDISSRNNESIDQNLSVGDTIFTKILNVTTNATIPHFIVNLTANFALATNYSNKIGKTAIVRGYGFVNNPGGIAVARLRMFRNPTGAYTPATIADWMETGNSLDFNTNTNHFEFVVPIGYNWTIYSTTSGGGATTGITYIEISDE